MGQLLKFVTSSAWMLLWAVLTVQSANAQTVNPQVVGHYPPTDDPWDGTDYRAVVQRVQKEGLALPTLADAGTKPVFDRMVNPDNIPLHMGLNQKLHVAIRFQKLDSALPAIHKLVVLYSNETQKGKPYATELASLMVYESKVSSALLEVSEPFLATFAKEEKYQARVADINQLKSNASQSYSGLVQGVTEARLYSKSDMLKIIRGALAALPAHQPTFTSQDKQGLTQKLTQQISVTTDQELKTALTELRDAIEHSRIPT